MRRLRLLPILLAAVLFGCGADTGSTAASSAFAVTPLATPSREPAALIRYPEEQAVLDALSASGMQVELIGGSKFDALLGAARRARVFIGTLQGSRVGADVLFLDEPAGDVRVCSSATSAPGFTRVVITVDGRPGSTGEGSQSTSFAVSDRFFVMSTDVRVRDALQRGLGLSVPSC